MAKQYKPGQFVSICGKLHRVKKAKLEEWTCFRCPYCKLPRIGKKRIACDDCCAKLLSKQYPEPIKPKRQG